MDTPASKAFMLGRHLNVLSLFDPEGANTSEMAVVRRYVQNFSRSLNIEIPQIPPLDTSERINDFADTIRMDLATVQSDFVSKCFLFGFHFSSWVSARGGYAPANEKPKIETTEDLRQRMEANLLTAAREIGLSDRFLNRCFAAAKDPDISSDGFDQLVAIDELTDISTALDNIDPRHVSLDTESSKQIFIVMKMDQNLEDVLDAIQNVADSLGLVAKRVDEFGTSGRITDSIVDGIRRSAFVIVDLTGARPNVYWEAGFAHGLGKTPIYIAREGTAPEFDVKDYPVIYYSTMRKLREGLEARLKSLLASH